MVDVLKEKPIVACAGEQVVIETPGAGIGGYAWRFEMEPRVGHLIREEAVAPTGLVGGGAATRFVFELSGHQDGNVRLVLQRPWENDPVRVIEYPVHCEK